MFIALFIAFALAQKAIQYDEMSQEDKLEEHRHPHHPFHFRDVKLRPNVGYYAFNFGRAGRPVRDAFILHAEKSVILSVIDCYCTGDAFDVFDCRRFIGRTEGRFDGDGNCNRFSENPTTCYNSDDWSILYTPLKKGKHNITIVPYDSPYKKGTGFIRADNLCPLGPPPVKAEIKDKEDMEEVREEEERENFEDNEVDGPGPLGVIRCCELKHNCCEKVVN